MPLLIGGATTSRQHTAVKIAPAFPGSTVHVLDASRAVGVVSSLLSTSGATRSSATTVAEQQRLRDIHAEGVARPLLPYAEARARRPALDFGAGVAGEAGVLRSPHARRRRSRRDREAHRLDLLLPRLGAEGQVPEDPRRPEDGRGGARALRERPDAAAPDRRREAAAARTASTASGRRNSDGDDLVLWTDASCTPKRRASRCCASSAPPEGKPCLSLADFVAPVESGVVDSVGAFAVTAGIGADALVARFEKELDDYQAILVKALADRLAEAFAEWLHARARREWGYGQHEATLARGSARRALPRHPAGVRLPGVPRPQREAAPLRPARRAGARHHAHRALRDAAGRERVGSLLRAPGGALLHRRPHRPRPGRGLRGAQGDAARAKSSAGSRRTSATSPSRALERRAGLRDRRLEWHRSRDDRRPALPRRARAELLAALRARQRARRRRISRIPRRGRASRRSFDSALRDFAGDRVVFVHAAGTLTPIRFAGEGDAAAYAHNVLLNSAAPQVLGDALLRALQDTSAAGRSALHRLGRVEVGVRGLVGLLRRQGGRRPLGARRRRRAGTPRRASPHPLRRARRGGDGDAAGDPRDARRRLPRGRRASRRSTKTGVLREPADVARELWALLDRDLPNGAVLDLRTS